MAGWLWPVGFFQKFVYYFTIRIYYVKPYPFWPPGASGRVRGLDWSVSIKNCTSGSSRAERCVLAAARRQNLARRATGAVPDVVIRGRLGALWLLRGAFFFAWVAPERSVFWKVSIQKLSWTVDVAQR